MDSTLLDEIRAEMIAIGQKINTLRDELRRARGANRTRIQDEINTLQPTQREIQRAYMECKRTIGQ